MVDILLKLMYKPFNYYVLFLVFTNITCYQSLVSILLIVYVFTSDTLLFMLYNKISKLT